MLKNIITIDGPSGVGKGTLAMLIAERLQWNYLNSGSLYRILSYLSDQQKIEHSNTKNLVKLTQYLCVDFKLNKNELAVFFNNKNITDSIQTEKCAKKEKKHEILRFFRYHVLLVKMNKNNNIEFTK